MSDEWTYYELNRRIEQLIGEGNALRARVAELEANKAAFELLLYYQPGEFEDTADTEPDVDPPKHVVDSSPRVRRCPACGLVKLGTRAGSFCDRCLAFADL